MKTNCLLGFLVALFAVTFLCGFDHATPISGVWHSKVGDQDTLHFHDSGLWQRDTVVWAKGKSYPVTFSGHFTIIDTNHVQLVVDTSNGSVVYTNEFYVVGAKLSLAEIEPPHIKMIQYDFISK